jgi:ferric-dicitrate binding protein FerR (iron transport regulator)
MLDSGQYEEQVKEYMDEKWNNVPSYTSVSNEQSDKIFSSILAHQQAKVLPVYHTGRNRNKIWIAASIITVVLAAGLLLLLRRPVTGKSALTSSVGLKYGNDILPGMDGAILKLADGSTIVLDSSADGSLSHQGSMMIIKKGGSLSYVQDKEGGNTNPVFNSIETPRGRQFHLVLEDGTGVWLNAASSIRFPVTFTGDERKVEVTGEAYFEVAKNKQKPFRVAVNGSIVEVLGTHFNINSYNDEETISTTLLEGSVRVVKGNNQQVISPGQQAQVTGAGNIQIEKKVNLGEVMAWKDNLFAFNNTDIKKLMRQLSRWYDVEIVFKNNITEPLSFNGDISRTATLSTVLKMLELTGEVRFTIEGKKITVEI